MYNMFAYCKSIKKLNLSSFETNKVNNMSNMFYKCEALEELNISNFTVKKEAMINDMFSNCNNLKQNSKIREIKGSIFNCICI